MSKKEIYICKNCGGENLQIHALVQWDFGKQVFVVHSTYDDAFCEDCEDTVSFSEQETETEKGDSIHQKLKQAEAILSAWLTDNTRDVFEEEHEIDMVRLLIDESFNLTP